MAFDMGRTARRVTRPPHLSEPEKREAAASLTRSRLDRVRRRAAWQACDERFRHSGRAAERHGSAHADELARLGCRRTISPDGKLLSFTRSPPSPIDCTDLSIWIMRRDGSDARRVVAGCGARWSPDGTRLVYAAPTGGGLFVVDVNGGTGRPLLSTPASEQPAGWSTDGRKILFTRSYDQTGRNGDVFVMNEDGTGVRRLAHGFAGCWSPNGSKILYTQSFASALFVMNADGSHKRRIVRSLASEPDWR